MMKVETKKTIIRLTVRRMLLPTLSYVNVSGLNLNLLYDFDLLINNFLVALVDKLKIFDVK